MKFKMKRMISTLAVFAIMMATASVPVMSAVPTADIVPLPARASENVLRFGVMSDTHIGGTVLAGMTNEEKLAKAYETFVLLDPDLEAIFTVGDVTDDGKLSQFYSYKEVMEEFMSPNTQNFLTLGNHDFYEASGKEGLDRFKGVFGYDATMDRVIDGYHFITISTTDKVYNSTTYAQYNDWLDSRLKAATAEDPDKPVFVFTHLTVEDTCVGSLQSQMDPESDLKEVLSKYPQVVTFSGHSHVSIADPRNIWQDDYTALNLGSVYYVALDYTNPLTAGKTDNTNIGYSPVNRGESSTAMLVEVEGSQVTIRSYDMYYDKQVGSTWTFDVADGKENFPYNSTRRYNESKAPQFTYDSKISFLDITPNGCTYVFDQAVNTSLSIPEDGPFVYEVSFVNNETGEIEDTARLQAEYYMFPTPKTISFNTTELSPDTEYTINVTPIGYFGKRGNTLTRIFCTTME